MSADPRPLTRRGLARLGLGALAASSSAGLVGCRLTDPVIHSERHNTGVEPTPEPTPDAEQLVAATAEAEVATDLAAVADPALKAPPPVLAWAAAALTAHQQAAHLLEQVDPMAVPPSGPAEVAPARHATLAAAVAAIKQRSSALAVAHRARSLQASDPALALLYTSLLLTAASQAIPTAPLATRAVRPHRIADDTPAQAQAVLLEHLHAVVQGYETGVALIAFTDSRRAVADARLRTLANLRDMTAAAIRAGGGDPPGPRPGYDQPIRPSTAEQALQLFVLLERQLLDALARQVPATSGADRDTALTALQQQVPHCQSWGGAMVLWPGYA